MCALVTEFRRVLFRSFSELYALVGIVDGQGERRIQRTCHGHGSSQRGETEQRLRVSRNRDCRCPPEAQRIPWLARWPDSLPADALANIHRKTPTPTLTHTLAGLPPPWHPPPRPREATPSPS